MNWQGVCLRPEVYCVQVTQGCDIQIQCQQCQCVCCHDDRTVRVVVQSHDLR